MAYLAVADFRMGGLRPWTANLALTEADGTNLYLDAVIASVATQVELDLDDDFDPPAPDVDETTYVDGTVGPRLYLPRRVRSLTSVGTRSLSGTITAVTSSSYRLHASLNAAGTAMVDGRKRDWIDSLSGSTWSSDGGIQLVGKFGWAAVPDDIKRLVALRVHNLVKATSDPHTTLLQRTTIDAVNTYGPSAEEASIMARYRRRLPATIG